MMSGDILREHPQIALKKYDADSLRVVPDCRSNRSEQLNALRAQNESLVACNSHL